MQIYFRIMPYEQTGKEHYLHRSAYKYFICNAIDILM